MGSINMTSYIRSAIFALTLLSVNAHAHSWYTDKHDPVTGGGCCGGHDCAVFIPDIGKTMFYVKGGVRIVLTIEQARLINRHTARAIDAVIPIDRIQQSPDGEYHLCISSSGTTPHHNGIYCFWAPFFS